MNVTTRFFIWLTVFSAAVYALMSFLQNYLPAKAVFGDFYIIQVVIFAVTLGLHSGLVRAGNKGPQAFVRFFMGATSVRLFIYMVIMVVYALLNRDSAFGFIMNFFIIYLLYTIFEVAWSYSHFGAVKRQQSK